MKDLRESVLQYSLILLQKNIDTETFPHKSHSK